MFSPNVGHRITPKKRYELSSDTEEVQ
ncbi:hypothetical protein FPSE_07307 [Fusarium pseudograminearum CS3096]|uniref:Uncharacterized protein n=1 Tax=Fusarium pseudograminearum (strain CS3096) TaxID=1028729 RepID=K3VZM7_FUSPC|nr:hypothetical protein FPSE_07307 [Fusarium pseudograminearum CS3096]EKJ72670.1 hypothetical protein FPSE_07307 [Fusarium pseudograminearum CS3096]